MEMTRLMAESDARKALAVLTAALDAHLTAVEAKSGENDPAVQAAFLDLREAAAAYDEAVFAEHDEVTPFDLPPLPEDDPEDDGSFGPRVTLLGRYDYTVVDPQKLLAQASALLGEDIEDIADAITVLGHLGARQGLASGENSRDVGLFWHGSVHMLMPCDVTELGDAWVEDAFVDVDPEDALCTITDALDETQIPGQVC
jgi:hypothetical protein